MVSRIVCGLIFFVVYAEVRVLGYDFKFEYTVLSSNSITLKLDYYDQFRIIKIVDGCFSRDKSISYYDKSIVLVNLGVCVCKLHVEVKYWYSDYTFPHSEPIWMIPKDIVLQTKSNASAIFIEVSIEKIAHCYDIVLLVANNTESILYTHSNLSSWLTISDLAPCEMYDLTIYLKSGSYQYEIYNKVIPVISMELSNQVQIMYDSATTTLRWNKFLGNCINFKYLIIVTPENEIDTDTPFILEPTVNELNLNFLDACSHYRISVTLQEYPDIVDNIISIPGPITNLKVELVNNLLLINWTHPNRIIDCFLQYNVQIDNNSFQTTEQEFKIVLYNPCKVYNITVCPTSDVELVNCANYLYDSFKFESNSIQNVSNIRLNTNDQGTTIVWSVTNHEAYCIKRYDFQLYDDLQQLIINESVILPMVKNMKLVACQSYQIRIETVLIQNSPTKIESYFEFTAETRRPDAPQPQELLSRTPQSFSLKTKYLNQNDKCKIEMFHFNCNNSQNSILRSVYDEDGLGIFSNLKEYTIYYCYATVKNEIGWSIPSKPVDVFTNFLNNLNKIYVNSVSSKSIEVTLLNSHHIQIGILKIVEIESNETVPIFCNPTNYNHSFELDKSLTGKYIFDNLEPNTNYSIQVVTKLEQNNWEQIYVTTDPDVPYQVVDLQILPLSDTSIILSWQLPCRQNGRIKHFAGKFIETNSLNLSQKLYKWTIPYSEIQNAEIFNYTEHRIKPDHNYTISVGIQLYNFVGSLNETKIDFYSAVLEQKDWATISKSLNEIYELQISETILINYQGSRFNLLISETECSQNESLNLTRDRCKRECRFTTIPAIVKITLNNNRIAAKCGDVDQNHIELKMGTNYILEGLILTSSANIIKTLPLQITTKLQCHKCLVLITVICLAFALVLAPIGWYCLNTYCTCSSLDTSYIAVKYFNESYKLLNQELFANEYESINNLDLSHLYRLEASKNASKNRYSDITPYDNNRVVLKPNGICTTGYINASYIDGYTFTKQYIATQGPKETTAYDFWYMVVTQKSDKIVMLTQLEENEISKCYKYFPFKDEKLKFYDLEIANVDETNFGHFIRRKLVISKGVAKRFIAHFQFVAWPDRGCPENVLELIEFIEFTKSVDNKSTNPMIVHCSAGVGRTGTFIALDILFQQMRKQKHISILNTVQKLRMQRCRMVQTVDQYAFLYASMNIYYLRRKYKEGRN